MSQKKLSTKLKTKIRDQRRRTIAGFFVIAFALIGVFLLFASRAAVNVTSVGSGNWSNPAIWSTGTVPAVGDTVTVATGHSVTLDVSTPKLAETYVRGTLTFAPNQSVKLTTNRNMLVTGKLVMKPSSPTIEHFIQFADINERNFQGGGMTPVATDVGMWIMDTGQIDTAGSEKRAWTSLAGAAAQGATSITLKEAPTGWRVGESFMIAPNEPPTAAVGSASYAGFDECVITGISGNTVNFNTCQSGNPSRTGDHARPTTTGLSRPRLLVNNKWTAEVGNLNRNVRIEGTYQYVPAGESDWADQDRHNGNSHIFIHSDKPQYMRYTQLRYMGSAGMDESQRDGNFKLGRYAIHMHLMYDASRGSLIDGVVSRDANFHSFVTHASHGVTLRNNIAFRAKAAAFWWDPVDVDQESNTHDTVWDHNLVALTQPRHYGMSFFLLEGVGNRAVNNVAVGIQSPSEEGGFAWFNGDHGVWEFDNNITHNHNQNGIQVWQNSPHLHPVGNFASYYNQTFGIIHGAYANDYHYFNGEVYGNRVGGIKLQANSGASRQQKYENMIWDGAGITPVLIRASEAQLPDPPALPTPQLFQNNVFKNWTQHAIEVAGVGNYISKRIDFVNPTFQGPAGEPVYYGSDSSHPNNRVRVQPRTGQAYQVTAGNVKTNIARFAPDDYGTGNGLLAEYFTGNFQTRVEKRLEPSVSGSYAEDETLPPPWFAPWTQPFTGRWTGEFEAQFDQPYSFGRSAGTGMRVWVDNELVLDAWSPTGQTVWGKTKQLRKGQRYPIKIEANFPTVDSNPNRDSRIYDVYVRSTSSDGGPEQYQTVLPHSQLYCGTDPACSINPYPPGMTPPQTPGQQLPVPDPDPTPAADTTAPSVSITAPAQGATVSGVFNVSANATDNVGVARVEFLVDGVSRGTDTTSPYTFGVDSLGLILTNGNHTIVARAFDAAGNQASTQARTVTVNNPVTTVPPPTPTYRAEDVNQDGRVNLQDFSLVASKFGQTGNSTALGRSDINKDGFVNLLDFSRIAAVYGQ